jgi:hypothetical protein
MPPKQYPLTNNINVISMDQFPTYRAVTLNKQLYNAGQVAKNIGRKYKRWPGVSMLEAKVPHSRRNMTPQEINTIMRKSGKQMVWSLNTHLRVKGTPPTYGNYKSTKERQAMDRQEKFFEKAPAGVRAQNRAIVGAEMRLVKAYVRIVADTAATLVPQMAQYMTAPEVDRISRMLEHATTPDAVFKILLWPVYHYLPERLEVVSIYTLTQASVQAMEKALLRFSAAVTAKLRLVIAAGMLSNAELTALNTLLIRLEHTMVKQNRAPRTGRRTKKAHRRVRKPLDAFEVFTKLLGPVITLATTARQRRTTGLVNPYAMPPPSPFAAIPPPPPPDVNNNPNIPAASAPPYPNSPPYSPNNLRRRRPTLANSPAPVRRSARSPARSPNRSPARSATVRSLESAFNRMLRSPQRSPRR